MPLFRKARHTFVGHFIGSPGMNFPARVVDGPSLQVADQRVRALPPAAGCFGRWVCPNTWRSCPKPIPGAPAVPRWRRCRTSAPTRCSPRGRHARRQMLRAPGLARGGRGASAARCWVGEHSRSKRGVVRMRPSRCALPGNPEDDDAVSTAGPGRPLGPERPQMARHRIADPGDRLPVRGLNHGKTVNQQGPDPAGASSGGPGDHAADDGGELFGAGHHRPGAPRVWGHRVVRADHRDEELHARSCGRSFFRWRCWRWRFRWASCWRCRCPRRAGVVWRPGGGGAVAADSCGTWSAPSGRFYGRTDIGPYGAIRRRRWALTTATPATPRRRGSRCC